VAPATLSSGDGDDPGPPADAAVDIPPWASIAGKWRAPPPRGEGEWQARVALSLEMEEHLANAVGKAI
jgi:hypothetical protein